MQHTSLFEYFHGFDFYDIPKHIIFEEETFYHLCYSDVILAIEIAVAIQSIPLLLILAFWCVHTSIVCYLY